VEELFELVRVGDEVDLIGAPTPEEAALFEESHTNKLQATAVTADVRSVGGMQ
jgi:hypothetical protein